MSTFADACDKWFQVKGDVGDSDWTYLTRLRRDLGDIELDVINRGMIDALVTDDRYSQGLKDGSVRRELNTCQAILNCAVEYELTNNYVKVRKPKDSPPRDVFLSAPEVRKFLESCTHEFRPFATLLFRTGLRLSEAINAKWCDVYGDVLMVKSRKGKGSKEKIRAVPLHNVLSVLDHDSKYLVHRRCGSQWTKRMVYLQWHIPRVIFGRSDLTPHCARHTFASNMLTSGVDSRVVAELLGHSSMDMMKRYTHFAHGHLVDAVKLLKT